MPLNYTTSRRLKLCIVPQAAHVLTPVLVTSKDFDGVARSCMGLFATKFDAIVPV